MRLALPAPPIVTGFYRMLFGTLLVGAYLLWRRRPLAAAPRHAALALASGVCFGTDHAIWNTSLVHTTVANSTLLVNTTPLYVGLWSLLVLHQPLHPRFVGGTALAFAGAALLLGVSWGDQQHVLGDLLALAAAIFYTGIAAAGVRRDQVAQLRDHSHVAVDDLHSTACDPSPTAGGEVLSAAACAELSAPTQLVSRTQDV